MVGIRATQLPNYQLQIDGAELTPVDESIARSDDFAISNLSYKRAIVGRLHRSICFWSTP